jgi:hypothetical protein
VKKFAFNARSAGVAKLENLLERLQASPDRILPGEAAFDLYATYGLPLEMRDIAREQNLDVDETGSIRRCKTIALFPVLEKRLGNSTMRCGNLPGCTRQSGVERYARS